MCLLSCISNTKIKNEEKIQFLMLMLRIVINIKKKKRMIIRVYNIFFLTSSITWPVLQQHGHIVTQTLTTGICSFVFLLHLCNSLVVWFNLIQVMGKTFSMSMGKVHLFYEVQLVKDHKCLLNNSCPFGIKKRSILLIRSDSGRENNQNLKKE